MLLPLNNSIEEKEYEFTKLIYEFRKNNHKPVLFLRINLLLAIY